MNEPLAQPVYRQLTSRRRGVGVLSQLALGPDHLLHIVSTGYTENYHRLYFRDIQSIVLVHSARRLYINVVLLSVAVLGTLIGLLADAPGLVYIVIVAPLLPFIIWNSALGPGCWVEVMTAVRREKIPSLDRQAKARRIFAVIFPAITEAQRDFTTPISPAAATPPPLLPGASAGESSSPTLPPPLPPLVS